MKRYLKIISVAFLAGVGAARVLIWLNMGIVHLLVMRGGWEVAAVVNAAPWILFALGSGMAFSLYELWTENQQYTRSAKRQVIDRRHARTEEPECLQNRMDA